MLHITVKLAEKIGIRNQHLYLVAAFSSIGELCELWADKLFDVFYLLSHLMWF